MFVWKKREKINADATMTMVQEDAEKTNNLQHIIDERESRLNSARQVLASVGKLKDINVDGAILLTDRVKGLSLIPHGGNAAEVGVAYGDFSKKIIDTIKPDCFYAIDYFSQDDPYCNFWGEDRFRKDNMPHQQWYENRFKAEIDEHKVVVRQGFSWDVLETFEDDFFDYVYLDAGHDYESVRKDISVLCKKVKDGGIIQFNDYTVYSILEDAFYGIVPAVNDFIAGSHHKIIALCLQENGYYDILVQLHK